MMTVRIEPALGAVNCKGEENRRKVDWMAVRQATNKHWEACAGYAFYMFRLQQVVLVRMDAQWTRKGQGEFVISKHVEWTLTFNELGQGQSTGGTPRAAGLCKG